MFTNAAAVLPPLYEAWMGQFLGAPIPAEVEATCDECAMLAGKDDRQAHSTRYYDPRTKCCTYVPELPNFLAGRILADDDPAAARGRATVEARVCARVAVTPLGLSRSSKYTLLYRNSVMAFGRNQTLRCPHYLADEGGRCGVWRHRESTCATWFCKHVRGATGKEFWRLLHQMLAQVEKELARWCVLEVDLGCEPLRRLFPPPSGPGVANSLDEKELDETVDDDVYKALWGVWAGREGEFYRECARRVSRLEWKDVLSICGPEVQISTRLVGVAYKQLVSTETAEQLRVGPFQVVGLEQDSCRLVSYSSLDPIESPRLLLDVLGYFDGRPTGEAIKSIAAERGIKLDEELVRKLADFRVLVPAENGGGEP